MSEFGEQKHVCDISQTMRIRLICGLYNRRSISPRFQRFAQVYCMILAISFSIYTYFLMQLGAKYSVLNWLPFYCQYVLASFVSLWTGDEYIYKFYTQNKLTDVTLDSPMVFRYFQKQIKYSNIFVFGLYLLTVGITVVMSFEHDVFTIVVFVIPQLVVKLVTLSTYTTKLLVMGLFNSRIQVLRRRLERYGFRTIGRAPPQPYCQIYDEIWQGLYATDNPLKVMLFFDLIFSCGQLISSLIIVKYMTWKDMDQYQQYQHIVLIVVTLTSIFRNLYCSFVHVALLETAEAHCEGMAIFTATQLIKTPSAEERQRMYALLRALELRGARYHVLRALPLNARLVLQALGFCSAQALVFSSMLQPQ